MDVGVLRGRSAGGGGDVQSRELREPQLRNTTDGGRRRVAAHA